MTLTHPIRTIVIGAHPDDCEYFFGGAAAKLAQAGHQVKFVSVTNGDAGHQRLGGDELIALRRAEAAEAARRLGIAATEVLSFHDGLLEPSLDARREIIRQIRAWRADLVFTHRPFDYHPDHRATSQIVQDSAFMVLVPNICPETPALRTNPVYFYLEDDFQKPAPFAPDIAVAVDSVWDTKVAALDAHASQMYEWLPWVDWNEEPVPEGRDARLKWIGGKMARPITAAVRARLAERYGPDATIHHAESFEICEYGRRPSPGELDQLLPR